jgi:hypothetical protein
MSHLLINNQRKMHRAHQVYHQYVAHPDMPVINAF